MMTSYLSQMRSSATALLVRAVDLKLWLTITSCLELEADRGPVSRQYPRVGLNTENERTGESRVFTRSSE